MRYNKKAISDIVATVLIIMITVAAVGIIGAIVVPMVRDSLTGGSACFNALSDVAIDAESGWTCITKSAVTENDANISVQIRKGSDVNVNLGTVDIIVGDASGSEKSYRINSEDSPMPGINEAAVFTIENVNNNSVYIKLVPVLQLGNKLKECDATGKVTLVECK